MIELKQGDMIATLYHTASPVTGVDGDEAFTESGNAIPVMMIDEINGSEVRWKEGLTFAPRREVRQRSYGPPWSLEDILSANRRLPKAFDLSNPMTQGLPDDLKDAIIAEQAAMRAQWTAEEKAKQGGQTLHSDADLEDESDADNEDALVFVGTNAPIVDDGDFLPEETPRYLAIWGSLWESFWKSWWGFTIGATLFYPFAIILFAFVYPFMAYDHFKWRCTAFR